MMKYLAGLTGILVICLAASYVVIEQPFAKPLRFAKGDCLKMDFDGVESWFDNIVVRVDHVGKDNYGVKHWFEGYWSRGTGTWPFDKMKSIKVECPVEIEEGKL